MSKKLTIGMRCRFKPEGVKGHSWSKYGGYECLLEERSGGSFSVMVLRKGKNVELKKEDSDTIISQVAWVDEDDLEFVNAKFKANLDFIDWYQAHIYDFCGDCGTWFPDRGRLNPKTNEDYVCPNENCAGRLYDSGICPCCKTPAPEKGDICPECGFNWQHQW